MDVRRGSVVRSTVHEVGDGRVVRRRDALAVEEPLEIRLLAGAGGEGDFTRLSVTMRTPGNDFDLTAGFLLTEGILRDRRDLLGMSYCVGAGGEQNYNVVNAVLRPGVPLDAGRLTRNLYAASSCGVCGKASLEAVRLQGLRPLQDDLRVGYDLLAALPDMLRRRQSLFDRTGGLHAAALFDEGGRLIAVREDVGRHNAVDKLVGERLLAGALPLSRHILLVSGRAGFEITQKAAAAGIPVVCSVSAPSSLAVDLAREFGMTLIGFLRGGRFNIYAGEARVGTGLPVPRA